MTAEYGRGAGSDPWHPDDPLYGDQGWSGGYDTTAGQPSGGWDPYGGAPQQPQQDYYDPSRTGQWEAPGQYYDPDPYSYGQQAAQQPFPPGPHDTGSYPTGQHQTGQHPTGQHQTGQHPTGQHPTGQHPTGQHQTGGYGQHPTGQHPTGQHPTGQHPTGQHPVGGHPAGPYPTGGQQAAYGRQDAYPAEHHPHPQHQPRQHPHGPSRPQPEPAYQEFAAAGHPAAPGATRHEPGSGPDPETGWDPGPDQGEHDFFSRRDDDDADDEVDVPRARRAERRGEATRPKRRRGGCGCLALALVLVGGVGGVGYYGYQQYQDRFGPAPDFAGEGSGQVQVEIPEGATASDIGNLLKEAGVVKSHDAFVEAASADQEAALSIQPGVYSLRQEMSAESALQMLTDPSTLNVLTIPEGLRATEVYAAIDEKLGQPEGTTEDVAESADLGLPEYAEGDVEGFLFPARYDVGAETTPEELLTSMVDRAEQEFAEIDLESQAAELDRSPREIITVASLIQAEAQEDEEFGRVSRVIYNRLEQDMRLEFDSTINYAMGRSTLNTSIEDTQFDSPYNTYVEFGLPPGPIDNPGHQALEAALNPADGPWLYFVTVSPGDTRFTDDFDEHQANVDDFNAAQEGNE
ncbi:endolytic transglycosylase MltG [Streptomyces sp. B6B3]|uniref:endolytic transglycosylase MltG n=1 Tax=Streptomyces sp. B6B3 TaxID=3153570 RepID=UPI00325CD203